MKTYKIIFKYDGKEDKELIKTKTSFLALNIFEDSYDYDEIIDIKIKEA
jgi:hypothetical protein